MAGISAIRQPSHSFSVTDKLQKLELFARARAAKVDRRLALHDPQSGGPLDDSLLYTSHAADE
ncbi:MAG: hypothetical protein RIR52_1325, partial [Acidobacteriota bacterium]